MVKTMVSGSDFPLNQSIEPLVSYHLLTIYTIYTMVDNIYTMVINTSHYTSIYGSTVQMLTPSAFS